MLLPRIIPCLLVRNKGLVKTIRFKDHKYVGDPINAVRIFNEKEVDELIVLDIDATIEDREPDYQMIENLAAECRMPFCYGGGIKTKEQAQRIFNLGVEKIALSSAVMERPELVSELAERVGSQSIVVVIDVKRDLLGRYDIYTHNGTRKWRHDIFQFVQHLERAGMGELVLNAIDRDGTMKGYDLTLIRKIRELITVPMTAIGGAGSLEDMGALIDQEGIIGAAAGSLFVFKGVYRAVLITYPSREEKKWLMAESQNS